MRPVYRTRRRGPSGLAIGLALTVLVVGGGLGFYLGYWRNRETGSHAPNAGGVHIPASDALPHTWGYVGCSDTHDTVAGYHLVSSKHLFWPFRGYEIGGKAVPEWNNPNDDVWRLFRLAVRRLDGGRDPPVIWVQPCIQMDPDSPGFDGPVSFDQVVAMIQRVHQNAPTSKLFVSPLPTFEPPDLCPSTGPRGREIPTMTRWLTKIVDQGLAFPGPGIEGNAPLGPLTKALTVDGCHPNGPPNGPGDGTSFVGRQLAAFFDALPGR